MRLDGVFTALVTPFDDGAVDLATFTALCERQLAAGVDGLVPCGTTGETPTLTSDEWAELVAAAVKVAKGRVPVIAGCGTNATEATVANITRARALGAQAALVVFPYYNKPNPDGLRAHVRACASAGLPLVLYHVPGRTGQRLDGQLLAELCNTAGVVACKEATGDVAFGLALIQATERAVLSGDDATFGALRFFGAAGVISVLSNVAPALTVAWDRACRDGDSTRAQALSRRLLPVVRWLFHTTNPVPVKAMMAAMDLCRNEVRLPLASIGLPPRALWEGLE